jgi:hypothetical protein
MFFVHPYLSAQLKRAHHITMLLLSHSPADTQLRDQWDWNILLGIKFKWTGVCCYIFF